MDVSSSAMKKTFSGKKEINDVYIQKGRVKNDRNQHRSDAPRRQFTKINMLLS